MSKLQPPSPSLDYDSQEEDEAGQQQSGAAGFPKLLGREGVDGGPEERKEEGPAERKSEEEDQEDQEKDTRSPRTLLLSNVRRYKEKFSQVRFVSLLMSYLCRVILVLQDLKCLFNSGLCRDICIVFCA